MSLQRSAKPTKNPTQPATSRASSHLAMVELKQRILNSLSKLADRDTHQIAAEDLEKIIQSISNDAVSMLLNCLYDAVGDPKPAVKKEGIRLLAALCAAHTDAAATHLTKIVAHIVKRLKDSDSQVRDACRDAIGALAGLYLKGGNSGGDGAVSLFVKPLFEVMNENNKAAQGGASMCLAKMVECASDQPVASLQKLCPRVCKYLSSPNFFAKAPLLQVVSTLSQVGAIAPQNLEQLLQSIHEFLGSSDWTTRKAAADALSALALNTRDVAPEAAGSILNVLEACRFDKIKPVRESMTEALQLWKKISGKGEGSSDEHKDREAPESSNQSDRKDLSSLAEGGSDKTVKTSSNGISPSDSSSPCKANNNTNKIGASRRKVPALTDKECNPEFFQKLEARYSSDLPVEVVVPRQHATSNSQNDKDTESSSTDSGRRPMHKGNREILRARYESKDSGLDGNADANDANHSISSGVCADSSDGLVGNKGNWLTIQRQLLQLERQQAHLMNMLQDFMGGSHGSMVTLESRVRSLERVVEDMARDLSISAGRRGSSTMAGYEGPLNRHLNRYGGFQDHSSAKLGRGNDGGIHFGERLMAFDGVASAMRNRGPSWRSDATESWELPAYSKNGHMGSRRAAGGSTVDSRPSKSENESDLVGSRRAWEKGSGPIRFGEGPSARSVWQASKDEATLEAIRVAGEDTVVCRNTRAAIPEMTAEALGDDEAVPERDPVWTSWSNAMDALHVGDVDSAFAEVLSTGDDLLLVKLMDRTGPIIDQLSTEVASEVLHAVSQLLVDQNLFDLCLFWLQQLADMVMENGPDAVEVPMDVKRGILLSLHDSSSSVELPEDWEGLTPDQLLLQLASGWGIDLQHLEK